MSDGPWKFFGYTANADLMPIRPLETNFNEQNAYHYVHVSKGALCPSSPPSAPYKNQINRVSIGSDYGLPLSHYLNQCWVIVNRNLRNKLQWNSDRNTKLFIHENVPENAVCEMADISFRGRWVKQSSEPLTIWWYEYDYPRKVKMCCNWIQRWKINVWALCSQNWRHNTDRMLRVMSRRRACLVTWFCYHLIAKPGNKTGAPSCPDPYAKRMIVI